MEPRAAFARAGLRRGLEQTSSRSIGIGRARASRTGQWRSTASASSS